MSCGRTLLVSRGRRKRCSKLRIPPSNIIHHDRPAAIRSPIKDPDSLITLRPTPGEATSGAVIRTDGGRRVAEEEGAVRGSRHATVRVGPLLKVSYETDAYPLTFFGHLPCDWRL
ncbi:hypothetical protein GW17_00018617 [Ensete ventricosum]|nr:hypothetical protein GW17_00018617 [Ensete ventricosum]